MQERQETSLVKAESGARDSGHIIWSMIATAKKIKSMVISGECYSASGKRI